ncbi:hypothetical protein TNCV_1184371 [Trichonephila clavipes]|nr:hypothetical protein TNCV_1184371 [Trichonephila clavipes]
MATGNGPHNFEPGSSWEDDIRAGTTFSSSNYPALHTHQRKDIEPGQIYYASTPSSRSEIELAIPFVPNRDPPDTPQQSELGEVVHYHPSE